MSTNMDVRRMLMHGRAVVGEPMHLPSRNTNNGESTKRGNGNFSFILNYFRIC